MPPKKAKAKRKPKTIRKKTSAPGPWEIALGNVERVTNETESKKREDGAFLKGRRYENQFSNEKPHYEFTIQDLSINPEFKAGKKGVPEMIPKKYDGKYAPKKPISAATAQTHLRRIGPDDDHPETEDLLKAISLLLLDEEITLDVDGDRLR